MALTATQIRMARNYNANLTNHLFLRMIYNPSNEQYKRDYENRFKKFKAVV